MDEILTPEQVRTFLDELHRVSTSAGRAELVKDVLREHDEALRADRDSLRRKLEAAERLIKAQDAYMAMQRAGIPKEAVLRELDKARQGVRVAGEEARDA